MKSIFIISLFLISITTNAQLFFSTYGGIHDDRANYIQEDSLGNFILCGESGRTTNAIYDSQGLFLKYDADGNLLWAKTYGDTLAQRFRAVKLTLDGGYLLHGDQDGSWVSGCESLILKTNSAGDSLWSTTDYGTMDYRFGVGIIPLSDTTYIIASREDNIQLYNPLQLQKIDSVGHAIWSDKTDVIYNGGLPYSTACMIRTNENSIAVTGTNYIGGTGDLEIIVAKVDTHGVVLWSKQYGSSGVDWISYSISQTSDSGYIVSGAATYPAIVGYDLFLIRLDANGDSLWTKRFGGPGNEFFTAAQQTYDGGFVAFGYSDSYAGNFDAIIMKLDANGDSLWLNSYGGINNEIVNHGIICHDQGYAITGSTKSYGVGGEDVFILRTDSSGNVITNTKNLNNPSCSIFPNPFRDEIYIRSTNSIQRIFICDLSGRIVSEINEVKNDANISLSLNAGIYFCTVVFRSGNYKTEKIVCLGK